jgi:SAM-dependent methyltransferase
MTTYALPNAWQEAAQRLALLEACYDPVSVRQAEALGVGLGWRCLEAGAGHGSFARWLAGRVHPGGSVLAVDLDVRLLEHLDTPGLQVRPLDLTRDDLPRDAFDFVHARLVLIHLAERDHVLERLAAAVRPGGVLMVEEDDIHPILATARGDYREAWWAFAETMRAAGLDPEWARGLPEQRLPEQMVGLGLVNVGATVDTKLFAGRSPTARFWSLTWLQIRERAGSAGDVLDRGRAALDDPSRWFHGPATVTAWGRRA